jgi:UDP-N-acetylglucosamine 2-epimerase (non-hydrolysing)
MPEEINRLVTDSITDYYYTTSEHANQNLKNAGIHESRIIFVGNTMIDTLKKNLDWLKKPFFMTISICVRENILY